MTSSRRLPAFISGAVALSLVVSGCSLVDHASDVVASAGGDVLAHAVLAATVAELESLDGVEAASYELQADAYLGNIGRVSVIATSTIDGAQLGQLSEQFRDGYTAIERVAVEPHFSLTLTGDATGKFDLWEVPESNESFVENFEFWRAASAAVDTELWLEILPGDGWTLGVRSIAIPDQADFEEATDRAIANYGALQEVELVEDDRQNYWQLAGIQSVGELAPLRFVELVSDLRTIMPLFYYQVESDAVSGDADFPQGFQVGWGPPGADYGLTSVIVSSNEYTDESRSNAIRAATRTSEIEGVNFQFAMSDRVFWMHTSACNDSVVVTADDDLFFEDVAASGAKLFEGAGPGACFPN
ncbi:hypothetical protein [Salinibacterium sp. NK8237]|uniref:hypothetical protein n=1 Tax=Salinibacterium sp. NK8237 TaxID=2792038 RepID=UPI0018CF0391|nr:hypothetical protein [Salinibacterium sp. NK8237]MBH0130047.1 hypothetical protein [Salinibacterium sp. NK8237]